MIDGTFNFFSNIPKKSTNEIIEQVLKNEKVKIERIVSYGQTTPKDYWYNQDKDEFVIILNGSAKIKYNDNRVFELNVGDSLYIPSHQKHQVIYTDNPTVWLAIFIN